MFWGKSIFPTFAVNHPMPAMTLPPQSSDDPYGVPGSELPVDIANAITQATFTAFVLGLETLDDLSAEEQTRAKFRGARAALDAVILKHLRGEA